MALSTVNISFKNDLLQQIDEIAEKEARTRSELIREAARLYYRTEKTMGEYFRLRKKYFIKAQIHGKRR